jgi:periplasmic glucans biosynthesis protein
VKGFGLLQRDRLFEHYQDLDLNYENRPSYWIEPIEGFGEGRVELVELPTPDETNDNIVAYFVRATPIEAGQRLVVKYRMSAMKNEAALHKGAKAVNSYKTKAVALGGNEAVRARTTRFIVDFAGGDLEYYLKSPHLVQIVPSVNDGQILRTFIVPNAPIKGFRAAIDVQANEGKTANLRAFLKSGEGALSETWTYIYAGD